MRLSESRKEEIFESLLADYQAFVFKIAYSFVRDVQRSEDISQDVFLDAYRSLERLKDYSKLSGWLKAVTRNKCIDFLKKNSQKIISIDEYPMVRAEVGIKRRNDGRDRIYSKETTANIMSIIDSLPDTQRQALILRHTEQISYKEIADILEITITALKSILFRARRTIRREMERIEKNISEDVS